MKEDLIADIWTLVIEHIPEKHRKDLAADFVTAFFPLLDKPETPKEFDRLLRLLGPDGGIHHFGKL